MLTIRMLSITRQSWSRCEPLVFLGRSYASEDKNPISFGDLHHSMVNKLVKEKDLGDSFNEEVQGRIKTLLSNLQENQFNKSQLNCLNELMQSDSKCLRNWLETCKLRPELLSLDSNFIVDVKKSLVVDFNITGKRKVFKVIRNIPTELYKSKDINFVTASLWNVYAFCKQRDLDFVEIIEQIPLIVLIDPEKIDERCDDLAEYFGSRKEVNLAIQSVPSILIDYWPNLKYKFEFIIHEMQVFPRTLAKSKVLGFDLQHIKDRYEFLNRAGLYQHPSVKSHGNRSEAYPNVSDVVETKLSVFIKDVAKNGFLVQDYEYFIKMLNEDSHTKEERIHYINEGHDESFENS